MEDYRIISSKKLVIDLNDQQKEDIPAALQVELDNLPGSSHQNSLNPVKSEVIEILSDEDDELEEDKTVIVSEENNDYSDEEVLGFLTNNSSNEAHAGEVMQPSFSSIDETAVPLCSDPDVDLSCNISPDCYMSESETQSTLSASEKGVEKSPGGVIELSESDLEPDSEKQSDNSNVPNEKNDVQFVDEPVIPGTLNTKDKISYDEYITYYCPECGIDCGCIESWKLHTVKEHNFDSLEAVNMRSLITKDGNLSYQCGDCHQKFKLNVGFARLISHRIKHLPFSNYVGCRLCNLKWETKISYVKHIQRSHAEVMSELSHPYDGILEHIRISCHICHQQQNSVSDWREHLKKKHDYYTITKSKYVNDGKMYNCNVCGVNVRLHCLTLHMLLHEVAKTFSCTYCNDFQSNVPQAAINHVRHKHLRTLKDLVLKCTFCKSTFKTRDRRRIHYETEHKAQLKRCKVCKKGFGSASALFRHMNLVNHHSLK